MSFLDDILAGYQFPSPLLNQSPTGTAYPGQFNLPGFLNSPDFGANAQPFMPAPAGPPPAAPAPPIAPQSVTYPSPVQSAGRDVANAAAYGSMGVDPAAVAPSPFEVAVKSPARSGPRPVAARLRAAWCACRRAAGPRPGRARASGRRTARPSTRCPLRLSAAVIRRHPEVCREAANSSVIAAASARRRAWVGVSTRWAQA